MAYRCVYTYSTLLLSSLSLMFICLARSLLHITQYLVKTYDSLLRLMTLYYVGEDLSLGIVILAWS